jgi:NAD+ kinase
MKIKIVSNRNYPELKRFRSEFDVSERADICLAIGGDGMLVKAAKEFDGPILPIRSEVPGSTGYYSDVSLADIDFIIEHLKKRRYVVETLENKIEILYKGSRYYAVNEAVLHNVLQEVNFKIYEVVNGRRSAIYPFVMGGDGLLITGVMGSTAYNRSAGGPVILSPEVFCITFLNVDGPYKNPIVVDSKKTIEVEVVKYHGRIEYDGENITTLKPGDKFGVRLSPKVLKVIRFPSKKEGMDRKLERIIRSRLMK